MRAHYVLLVVAACGSSPHSGTGDAGAADARTTDGGAGGPTVGGCPLFPADYPYNVEISNAPLDPISATYIANLKARAGAIVAEYPGIEYVNIVPQAQP